MRGRIPAVVAALLLTGAAQAISPVPMPFGKPSATTPPRELLSAADLRARAEETRVAVDPAMVGKPTATTPLVVHRAGTAPLRVGEVSPLNPWLLGKPSATSPPIPVG